MHSATEDTRAAIASRLTSEFGDRGLSLAVVDRLDARAVEVLAAQEDLDVTELLDFAAPRVLEPEVLVVFAFGNRLLADGALEAGPVNLEMAALADAWVAATGLPVIAQWEVADEMTAPAERVGVVERADGSVEYLSTIGVAEQARELTGARRVAVLAMADHVVRCCRSLERVGFEAGTSDHTPAPTRYDQASGQPWTRDRATYVAVDILARCLM